MKCKLILILLGTVILTGMPIRGAQAQILHGEDVAVALAPKQTTKVLVVDWLEDPWIDKFREDLDPFTPGVQNPLYIDPVNDTRETAFWNTINADANIEINRISPTGSILAWTDTDFTDKLASYQPDVVVLADLNLDLWDRFGLSKTERQALYDYLEQGNGLVLLGGSLSDMRYKTSSQDTLIGTYGHIDRLHLDDNPTIDELRDTYRASLAPMVGLGLLPLYEEVREKVGSLLHESPQTQELAPVVWSVPLCPIGVPFDGSFVADDPSDPILQGVGGSFSVDLTHPLKDPSLGKFNTTMIGWQLEYPFYMASAAIDATNPYIDELKSYFREGVLDFINNLTNYDPFSILPTGAPLGISAEMMDALAENVTNTLTELLTDMYQARLNTPTQLEIPIHFTIGSHTVDHTLAIPLPVELQALFKPAIISAISTDKLAAILRYEVGSHRAVTFTFNPVLGESTSQTLVKNALSWAANAPSPTPTIAIGNLNMSSSLVSTARSQITAGVSLAQTINEVQQPGEEQTYQFQLNGSIDSIIVYWRDGTGSVSVSKDGQTATSATYQDGTHFAVVTNVNEIGLWEVNVTTAQGGLLNPIAIELYQGGTIVTDTAAPTIDQPADLIYEVGTTGHSITWQPVDLHPTTYTVYRNNTPVASDDWNGSAISVNVDGLAVGIYNYTLGVNDTSGNWAYDTVIVTVTAPDTELPTIDHPADITYEEGITGNTITWQPGDAHPDWYNITQNGTLVVDGSWDGSTISINVDGLSAGTYNYTLMVVDEAGNFNSDTIIVIVAEAAPISSEPSESKAPSSIISKSEDGAGFTIGVLLLSVVAFVLVSGQIRRKPRS
ncbi:MAG: hypothetical protein ACE5OZ_23340 [Candidatus Heimdallarchaeota archaeon]